MSGILLPPAWSAVSSGWGLGLVHWRWTPFSPVCGSMTEAAHMLKQGQPL